MKLLIKWFLALGSILLFMASCSYRDTTVAHQLIVAKDTAPSMMAPAGTLVFLSAPLPVGDKYADIQTNPIQQTVTNPVSTFSLDVDTGSYSNVRRFLREGRLPPEDAVRVDELINYFAYNYAVPTTQDVPFTFNTELAPTPWNKDTILLRVAVRAKQPTGTRPPANLVFLLDTSGSMVSADRLPLLKTAMQILVRQLTAVDRIAIVTYAGSSSIALPSTPGDRTGDILTAINNLESGGMTQGSAGITTAYEVAAQNLRPGAINRVLLGTDGDFNVGITDTDELITLIKRERQRGIALTTLGFGRGNLNEQLMEQLADAGDGNYAYIDSAQEASKILARQVDATLFTVAKDVKVQIEFNPTRVAEYRLIGYENRVLQREDFKNDKVDAGDIGAGHTVTVLYELTPTDSKQRMVEPLRYQNASPPVAKTGNEWAFLRLRYKEPAGTDSKLLEQPINQAVNNQPDADFNFATAVAAFGQLLRGGKYTGSFGWDSVISLARGNRGDDPSGERAEFVGLSELAKNLSGSVQ